MQTDDTNNIAIAIELIEKNNFHLAHSTGLAIFVMQMDNGSFNVEFKILICNFWFLYINASLRADLY